MVAVRLIRFRALLHLLFRRTRVPFLRGGAGSASARAAKQKVTVNAINYEGRELQDAVNELKNLTCPPRLEGVESTQPENTVISVSPIGAG